MSFTLHETLSQMDRYVHLSDGSVVETVGHWLQMIDPADPTEYVLGVDNAGRFLVHRLDSTGHLVQPPDFIEARNTPIYASEFPRLFFSSQSPQLYA